MSEKPGPLNMGTRGGLIQPVERRDGTRTLECGAIYRITAETAPMIAARQGPFPPRRDVSCQKRRYRWCRKRRLFFLATVPLDRPSLRQRRS